MKPKLKWWIKERYNPQLGTYWVACGQLSKAQAKRKNKPIYGDSVMHDFDTGESYLNRLKELRQSGEKLL